MSKMSDYQIEYNPYVGSDEQLEDLNERDEWISSIRDYLGLRVPDLRGSIQRTQDCRCMPQLQPQDH